MTQPDRRLASASASSAAAGDGARPAPVGHQFGDEVRALLHRRLCLLAPCLLLACLYFLARYLGAGDPVPIFVSLTIQGGLLALLAVVTLRLYVVGRLSLPQLRTVEVLLFGLAAVFLSYRHCCTLYEAWAIKDELPVAGPTVVRLALGAATVRWLLLVVAYGALVPNSPRRCGVVLLGLCLLPVVLTAGAGFGQPTFWPALVRAAVPMAVALTAAGLLALFICACLNRVPAAALDGPTLGPYLLARRLKEGGMGEVFLAEHLLLRRSCAIKMIRPEVAREPRCRERFEREARTMAGLRHANVVAVFDAGRADDGTCYYVMEYLPGPSLGELVEREGPLPPARVRHVIRQVAGALHAAHARGFLHLDVTPGNVLTCGDAADTVKLIDFGLLERATAHPEATATEAPSGSPPYMSPEQAAGQGGLGARTDLYSLGAVAYFLLTGRPPFVRDGALPTLLAHAFDGVTPPGVLRADVPIDVQDVVMRCLEKDPERRFADAERLIAALDQCGCARAWPPEGWADLSGATATWPELTTVAPVA